MLLNKLKVRTKIAIVLAPLVAVIVALAWIAVTERLAEADEAAEDGRRAEVLASAVDVAAVHGFAAMRATEGETVDLVAAADVANRFLNVVATSREPSVSSLANPLAAAAEDWQGAMAALVGDPGPETRAALAGATTTLLDTTEAVVGSTAAATTAMELGPAASQVALHDAIVVLGLQLAATRDLPASSVDADALAVASARLDVALARVVVSEVEDPDVPDPLAVVRAGALSEEAVATAAAGGGPDPALATEVRSLAGTAASDAERDAVLVLDAASAARDGAQGAARNFALGSALALVAALVAALVVTKAITEPLRELTESTYEIATQRLPRLVERLRAPEAEGSLVDELVPLEVRSTDELGQLATAFNTMQKVTAEVAQQQAAMLRKGISDLFVNLARRNQSLLDRQIEFIDHLEAHEEDPDQLQDLFRLDHLATRMRRNAESLLVLAGAEPGRRRGRPVALTDVVRVAIGEVEHFARIRVVGVEPVQIRGNVAADLAHLLAELMDNATNYSPPDTAVEVVGRRIGASSYLLSVADLGIGMAEKQMAEINQLLARPPAVGLDLSRSLGLTVVARLAHRHGIAARVIAGDQGGVIAQVHLPGDVFDALAPPELSPGAADSPFERIPAGAAGALWGSGPSSQGAVAPVASAPVASAPVASGASATGSTTAGPSLRDLVARPAPGVVPAPAPSTPGPVDAGSWEPAPPVPHVEPAWPDEDRSVSPVADAVASAEPADPSSVRSVLPRRRPPDEDEATVTPDDLGFHVGSAYEPAGPSASTAAAGPGGATFPSRAPPPSRPVVPLAGTGPGLASSVVASGHRSPEEVRRMLSRYRSGLRRGQTVAAAGDPPAGSPASPGHPDDREPQE